MKQLLNIFILAGLLFSVSCSEEQVVTPEVSADSAVRFTAILQEDNEVIETKAKVENILSYVYNVSIRRTIDGTTNTETVTPYEVLTSNKGVLFYKGCSNMHDMDTSPHALKWSKDDLTKNHHFYAWTTPTGVTINGEDKVGEIDFVAGNKYKDTGAGANFENTYGGENEVVAPLEIFISAQSTDQNYYDSPTIALQFQRKVTKVSMRIRDWEGDFLTRDYVGDKDFSITFPYINQTWEINQTADSSFHVTGRKPSDDLTLSFEDLHYKPTDKNDPSTFLYYVYLPPLVSRLETEFAKAGDFYITYDGHKYYGSFANMFWEGGGANGHKELDGGRSMKLTIDLTENFGIGIGATISDWIDGGAGVAEVNPRDGIYTLEELVEFLQDPKGGKYEVDEVVKLRSNIAIPSKVWKELTQNNIALEDVKFDGAGFCITLPEDATTGLFTSLRDSEITNLRLTGNLTADGTLGLLANTTQGSIITNCHVLEGASVQGATAGGLIGAASDSRIISCSSQAAVSGTAAAGGVVGTLSGGEIKYSYGQCEVSGNNAGGLVGSLNGDMNSCVYTPAGSTIGITGGSPDVTGSYRGITEDNVSDSYFGYLAFNHEQESDGKTVTYSKGTFGQFVDGVFTLAPVEVNDNKYENILELLYNTTYNEWVFVSGKGYPSERIK